MEKNFLSEFKYFRGFSIFTIVWCHFLAHGMDLLKDSDFTPATFVYRCLFSIIFGNTALFVFISGFLFHHVFYQRGFDYSRFMKNKLKNVFCPYIVTLTIFTIFQYVMRITILNWGLWSDFIDFKNWTLFYWAF